MSASDVEIGLSVNGRLHRAPASPFASLQSVLHDTLAYREVRFGCGEGVCGACTVLLEERPVCACLVPAQRVDGRKVITAAGLASAAEEDGGAQVRALQQHLLARGAFQCGYCAPGMLVAAAHLLRTHGDQLNETAVREGLSGNLCRCSGYEAIVQAVLAAGRREPAPTVPTRTDLLDKIEGRVRFPSDAPAPKRAALVAGVLYSAEPSARIASIDTLTARTLTGVAAVLTAADLPGRNRAGNDLFAGDQPLLARNRVHSTSDALALVAAETPAALQAALDAIEVRYVPDEPVTDPWVAVEDRKRVLPWKSNIIAQFQHNQGDVERALAAADQVVEASFRCGHAEHVCLEPDGGLAYWDGDTLVLRVPSQTPYGARRIAAAAARLSRARVRIEAPRAGGAFGRHMVGGFEAHLAALAVVTGRDVRMLPSRNHTIRAGPKRHAFEGRYRMALKDGRVTALEAEMLADAGPYVGVTPTIVALFAVEAAGPYEIESQRIVARGVRTNNPLAAPMRGYGCFQIGFSIERMMDIAARRLDADPFAFRERHVKRQARDGVGRPTGPREQLPRIVAAARAEAEQRPRAMAPAGWLHGRGVAVVHSKYGYPYGMVDRTVAEIAVDADGRFTVSSDIPDSGTGVNVMAGRCAAKALGLATTPEYGVAQALIDDPTGNVLRRGRPPGRFSRVLFDGIEWCATRGIGTLLVGLASTRPTLFRRLLRMAAPLVNAGYRGTNVVKYRLFPLARDTAVPRVSGSRGMLLLGQAVEAAVRAFREEALRVAAATSGHPVSELTINAEGVRDASRKQLRWGELAERAGGRLAAVGYAQNTPGRLLDPRTGNQRGPIDFMDACHVCDVAVNPATGEVRVIDYLAVHDVGYVHHEELVRGQIYGGIAMGLGQAVGEVCTIEGGRVKSGSLLDIMVPTSLDVPETITVRVLESAAGGGPDGAKGIGEAAAVAAPIALAAAVSRATGAEINAIPLSGGDVFSACRR